MEALTGPRFQVLELPIDACRVNGTGAEAQLVVGHRARVAMAPDDVQRLARGGVRAEAAVRARPSGTGLRFRHGRGVLRTPVRGGPSS